MPIKMAFNCNQTSKGNKSDNSLPFLTAYSLNGTKSAADIRWFSYEG